MKPTFDVPSVPVQGLHERLGIETPVDYPASSLTKPLTAWKMEIDDSPILRYLYRHLRPRRHLEFGTWEGTGVLYCLEECDATVWTINLLEGERFPNGSWAYSSNFSTDESVPGWANKITISDTTIGCQTDAKGFIGRYYLDRGLGHRVCQIYADSRDWDITNYHEGFFDTCLIDGGHRPDVVANDTRKAVKVVRPGGVIMWHDFCPVPEVLESAPTAHDVVYAIQRDWGWLRGRMRDLFWVKPSWILIGVRGNANTRELRGGVQDKQKAT